MPFLETVFAIFAEGGAFGFWVLDFFIVSNFDITDPTEDKNATGYTEKYHQVTYLGNSTYKVEEKTEYHSGAGCGFDLLLKIILFITCLLWIIPYTIWVLIFPKKRCKRECGERIFYAYEETLKKGKKHNKPF